MDAEILETYRNQGFAVLRGVIPKFLLKDAQSLIEPWVEYWIKEWNAQGKLQGDYQRLDFWHKFLAAWQDSGSPHFRRTPNRFLINEEMYQFLTNPIFLGIAEKVLGTSELNLHGIFNARPQLPRHEDSLTPIHQDSQYWMLDYGKNCDEIGATHVLTMWIPLQTVDESSGCLQMISKQEINGKLFTQYEYNYQRTGFFGLSPQDIAPLTKQYIYMHPGDALIFDQNTPHGACPNEQNHIRWSLDIRYEATKTATNLGKKFGFIAQSRENPQSITPCSEWLLKRPDIKYEVK